MERLPWSVFVIGAEQLLVKCLARDAGVSILVTDGTAAWQCEYSTASKLQQACARFNWRIDMSAELVSTRLRQHMSAQQLDTEYTFARGEGGVTLGMVAHYPMFNFAWHFHCTTDHATQQQLYAHLIQPLLAMVMRSGDYQRGSTPSSSATMPSVVASSAADRARLQSHPEPTLAEQATLAGAFGMTHVQAAYVHAMSALHPEVPRGRASPQLQPSSNSAPEPNASAEGVLSEDMAPSLQPTLPHCLSVPVQLIAVLMSDAVPDSPPPTAANKAGKTEVVTWIHYMWV